MKGTKKVWILGSGFSKSLGGPLLYELISKKTAEETAVTFPKLTGREIVYKVYAAGLNSLWSHAEEFLDYVDTALMSDSPRRMIFQRHLSHAILDTFGRVDPSYTVEVFREAAILTVAAECSTLTTNCDVRSEAWAPYVDWACKLSDDDAIITFNYDLVLETVGIDKHVRAIGAPTVAFPTGAKDGRLHELNGLGICPIYKLHGSVDWAFKDDAPTKRISGLHETMQDDGYRPLIATPGATKTRYVNKMLRQVWDKGLSAILDAQVIVFIGYRFPPSDSEARTRLLHAIKCNKQPYLKVHTVLGPNVHEPDVVRLTGLLTHTLNAAGRIDASQSHMWNYAAPVPDMYSIVTQPLFAQDFLTVIHPGELYDEQLGQRMLKNRVQFPHGTQ